MNPTTKIINDISDAPIVLVCGPICGGKSTFCKRLAEKTNFAHIPVSKIVASIVNSDDRSVLQNSTDYTDTICEVLDTQITDALDQTGGVIVDGIRQPDILTYLLVLYGIERITMIWIDPGVEERKLRWDIRAAKKDQGLSFDNIDAADAELGLHQIKSWMDRLTTITQ